MLRSDRTEGLTRRPARLIALTGILAFLSPFAVRGSQAPPVVVSSVGTVPAAGLGIYQTDPAFDACGNIYTIQTGAVYFPDSAVNGGMISEAPAGGGTVTTVLPAGGPSYDSNSLIMDQSKNNLYVTEGAGGTSVYRIPIVNCVPQVTQKTAISISNLGPVSYYWSGSAVAADLAGDVFIATDVTCCGASTNELLEESSAGAGTALLPDLSNPITSMVLDAANNIYYVSAGAVYKLAYSSGTYSSKPATFGKGYQTAIGVSIDSLGNLYVADSGNSKISGSSAIFEIPNEGNAGLNPSNQFVVASGVPVTGPLAIDGSGNIYYTDLYSTNAGASIYELTRNFANAGSIAVGSSGTSVLNVVFNAAATLAAIDFVPGNGVFVSAKGTTCAASTAYKIAESCVVSAGFTPAAPGLAQGALVLADSAGAALATADLYGTGLGAGLTADPGTVTSIGSGLKTPISVALDASGDLFIADSGSNKVWEIAKGNTTLQSIGSGLAGPSGVAADGLGNVYIADTGNNRIVQIPVVNEALSTSAQTVLIPEGTIVAGSPLNNPAGVSVDAQGNLYIADTGNSRVVFLPPADNWSAEGALTLGSGFERPLAVTVASSGLIYIADSGNGKVYSISYPAEAVGKTLVATGFNDPSALAVDAAGDLFVVDKGNSQVLRIPNLSGSLVTTSALNVSLGIADPYGLAIDQEGNLYVSDDVNAAAYVVARTKSAQSFGKRNPKTTSDPASFQVENSGNQSLTFATPYYVATGDTSSFAQLSSEPDACASGGSVAAGSSCTLEATFTPAAFEAYSETLDLKSNATNAFAPEVIFSGTGAATLATTTKLTITSPGRSPYYEEAIALKVSVAASAGTPVGNVALMVDGVQSATGTLSNGAATFSLAEGLTGGSHTLQAAYQGAVSGLIVFSPSDSQQVTVDVSRVSTATALSFSTLFINPASQPAGQPFTLTASVGSSHSGVLTGTVSFIVTYSEGGSITGTAPLNPAGGGGFQATYSYAPTVPATVSTYDVVSIVASYGGDENFSGSSSATQLLDVAPAAGSVVVAPSATRLTGGSSITFTATSYGGWQGVVGYKCLASTLPANAICVFSPGQIPVEYSTPSAPYPPATTQLTVVVNNPPNSPAQSSMPWWLGGLTGLSLFCMRRRMMRGARGILWMLIGSAALTAMAGGVMSCGGGAQFLTPAGTSSITVVASVDPYASGSSSNSNPITQPCTAGPSQPPCSQPTFQIKLTVP
jgi:sugar lactone lactonase YvrE